MTDNERLYAERLTRYRAGERTPGLCAELMVLAKRLGNTDAASEWAREMRVSLDKRAEQNR